MSVSGKRCALFQMWSHISLNWYAEWCSSIYFTLEFSMRCAVCVHCKIYSFDFCLYQLCCVLMKADSIDKIQSRLNKLNGNRFRLVYETAASEWVWYFITVGSYWILCKMTIPAATVTATTTATVANDSISIVATDNEQDKDHFIKCIFFCKFHATAGPQIVTQVPKNYISKDLFDTISQYMIPKAQLQKCFVSV